MTQDHVPASQRAAGTGIIPPSRVDTTTVSVDAALSIGAVYRAISIIISSVTQMELGVFRNNREIGSLPPIIRQPNINDTPQAFIEETVFSLAAHGNAYWRLYRNSKDAPVQSIEVLDPSAVTIREDIDTVTGLPNGRRHYTIGGLELKSWQIQHLKLMRRPGQVRGFGPIQMGAGELLGALRLRDFADNWFQTSGVPTGLLTTEQPLNSTESSEYAVAWKAFLAQHGGTAVLSKGLKYEALALKPAEAQFLDVQKAYVLAIARLFGIPVMHLLAEQSGSSNTYLNLEQANIVFLQTTLSRYMNEIENALTSLLPRGQKVQFKEEGLLRLDSVTKWDVTKTQVEVGFTTGEELRREAGRSPLPAPALPRPASPPAEKAEEADPDA